MPTQPIIPNALNLTTYFIKKNSPHLRNPITNSDLKQPLLTTPPAPPAQRLVTIPQPGIKSYAQALTSNTNLPPTPPVIMPSSSSSTSFLEEIIDVSRKLEVQHDLGPSSKSHQRNPATTCSLQIQYRKNHDDNENFQTI